jgi:hypothetical protein
VSKLAKTALFVIPSAAEESTRSDSVLDARHCGNPFEQRYSCILAVQTGVRLHHHFRHASRRRPSAAALNEVKDLGATSSFACGSGRRKSAASAVLGMTKEAQSQFAHGLSPHLSRNRAGKGQKTAGMTTETIQITSSR